MVNEEIRQAISHAGIKQWKVADALGISEATFTRWLRKELPPEKKLEILSTISRTKEAKP